MSRKPLSTEQLGLIAERFKALSEPSRLEILNTLREGERTVSEILEATGLGQANVSKHLQLLHGVRLRRSAKGRRQHLLPAGRRRRAPTLRIDVRETGGGSPGEEEAIRLRARISFPAASSSSRIQIPFR